MDLTITDEKLQIKLTFLEQLNAARFRKSLEIPLAHIQQVTTAKPENIVNALRAPGTYIPEVIKAGTYYTNYGKEFWYIVRNKNYLVLYLKDESYQRIILTRDDNDTWQQRISQMITK